MEDLFKVGKGTPTSTITGGAGSVSRGLDGQGHLGFAAQPNLRTFGADIFTRVPRRRSTAHTAIRSGTATSSRGRVGPGGSGPSARRACAGAGVRAAARAVLTACGSSAGRTPAPAPASSEPPLGYRSLPSFLPTASTPVDRVVTATPRSPQLAVQGVGVQVVLPHGRTLATVAGPVVPPFVSPPPPAVTATFTVALGRTTGAVPVRLADFTVTDQLGRTYHLTPTAGEKLPASLPAHGVRPSGSPRSCLRVKGVCTGRPVAALPSSAGTSSWRTTDRLPALARSRA